ncbi:cytochrome P450 [Aspergillus novofumigatus IBT 16806]|uniref:Cytochrome P450 n=1 Tax=Aspergillus novofumigatus (strain IBT 16806) TaxID=1392255 RepID=A0A2I1C125_ASPN1|nr:cytochrome P450 [Aspergillus novofumigatus IBT 16806]PKX91281.1 cytochrome P450 [Aspergillus novofumigatus IBT 16806]
MDNYTGDALFPLGFLAIGVLAAALLLFRRDDELPLRNDKAPTELFYTNAKKRFSNAAADMLESGFGKARKTFLLMTDYGPRYIVPPEYAQDLQNHRSITGNGIIDENFHSDIPGLEIFKMDSYNGRLLRSVIRKKLKGIPLDVDWHEIGVTDTILELIARVTTRVFWGEQLSLNKAWLRIIPEYTRTAIMAAEQLHFWPKSLRPLVHWSLPIFRKLRSVLAETRSLLGVVLEKRKETPGMRTEGNPDFLTLVEWLDELSAGKEYDPALIHLAFFSVSLHTATDMLSQVVYDICGREQLVHQLRDEITSIISQDGGLVKGSLEKLKLLDSVMKESQRLKPAAIVGMQRKAKEDFHLPDGTRIAKGRQLMVPVHRMWDDSIYPNAQEFVPDRFLKLRQIPGQEDLHQCVSTNPAHMGFGYGAYACPGRFFAVHEIKIVLCHLLLKYDMKLVNGRPTPQKHGVMFAANMLGRISIRRRQEISI